MATKRNLRRGSKRNAKRRLIPHELYRRIRSRMGNALDLGDVLDRVEKRLGLTGVANRIRKTSRRMIRKAIRQVRH